MHDCAADETQEERRVPETVTLFRKCSAISDKDAWDPVDRSQSDLGCTVCDSTKRSSSCSTSCATSAKMYKVVSPRERESLGEAEEEPWEPPVLSFEPCIEEEEEVEEKPDIECTLAIVKPEAVIYRKQIERRIFEEGFEIYQTRWLQLTPEQVSEFYADKYGQPSFAHLVAYMASGPVIVHALAKRHAVQEWRLLVGPTRIAEARLYYPDSLRARFGRRGEDFKNAVHASGSREEAEREIRFFFPEFIIEPLLKNEAAADYLWETINPVLVEALSTCCKSKPADPVLWLATWLIANNPSKPKLPQDLAMSRP